jgi:hypothetical protein
MQSTDTSVADKNPVDSFDRRTMLASAGGWLAGAGALLAGAGGLMGAGWPATANAATSAGDDWMNDPARRFENFLRVTGDLSGRVSPQWWRGVYMGIVPGSQPRILFRLQGCEMKRLFRRSATECELQYRLFTSFDDPVTGEPLAGKRPTSARLTPSSS